MGHSRRNKFVRFRGTSAVPRAAHGEKVPFSVVSVRSEKWQQRKCNRFGVASTLGRNEQADRHWKESPVKISIHLSYADMDAVVGRWPGA